MAWHGFLCFKHVSFSVNIFNQMLAPQNYHFLIAFYENKVNFNLIFYQILSESQDFFSKVHTSRYRP